MPLVGDWLSAALLSGTLSAAGLDRLVRVLLERVEERLVRGLLVRPVLDLVDFVDLEVLEAFESDLLSAVLSFEDVFFRVLVFRVVVDFSFVVTI